MHSDRKFRWVIVAVVSCLSTLLVWSNSSAQVAEDSLDLRSILKPVLQQIERTQVPPQLPATMPLSSPFRQGRPDAASATAPTLPVYAVFTPPAALQGYGIVIGYSPDCEGGNACRIGTITGARKRDNIPLEQEDQSSGSGFSRSSPEEAAFVSLANGYKGWFSPWVCGGGCSDAVVTWDQGDYRYSVGFKLGARDQLIAMANSAIRNEGGS